MRLFLARGMASVAVLAGLALPDVGPRLHAGYLSCAGPGPLLETAVDDQGPALIGASLSRESEALCPIPEGDDPFGAIRLACWLFTSAGAAPPVDSRTSSTSTPNSLVPLLLSDGRYEAPRLVGFLQVFRTPQMGDPPPRSVFHPPRLL